AEYEQAYKIFCTLIGPNSSWIHDHEHDPAATQLSEINGIFQQATSMVSGYVPSSIIDDPLNYTAGALDLKEKCSTLHKWYGSLKGLYDGFPNISKSLDGPDIKDGLRSMASLASTEGWEPAVMAALICYHLSQHKDSPRARSCMYALYLLLSSSDEK
ncbi:hypothetical protein FOL47_006351, partial [Perkinsus chesapeaki]